MKSKTLPNPRTIDGFLKSQPPLYWVLYRRGHPKPCSAKKFDSESEAKVHRNIYFGYEMNHLKISFEIRGMYE